MNLLLYVRFTLTFLSFQFRFGAAKLITFLFRQNLFYFFAYPIVFGSAKLHTFF